jgi:general secretion pathway protein J
VRNTVPDLSLRVRRDDGSSDGNPVLPVVPDGIRIELTLPPGRALNGVMTVDWVNPLRSNSRS